MEIWSAAHPQENVEAFDIQLDESALHDIEKVHTRYRDPSTRPLDD